MVNKVILIGNIGRDPELKQTNTGSSVVKFSLATSEKRKGQDGQWQDHTEWHNLVTFGKTAENLIQYCAKGSKLFVEGRLQTRKWQDKEGKDRYSTEVVADNIKYLSKREEGQGGYSDGAQYEPPTDDSVIPF